MNSSTRARPTAKTGFVGLLLCSVTSVASAADALFIDNVGRIGAGTSSPEERLHVVSGSDAVVKVENTSTVAGTDRFMFQLFDRSTSKVRFSVGNASGLWSFDTTGANFQINKVGTGVNEFRVNPNGDIRARGSSYAVQHINTSSREHKKDFEPIDASSILDRLAALPITTWRYKDHDEDERHLGPTAEDFQQAFGLSDGQRISTVDADGVALAAIKGLHEQFLAMQEEVKRLRTELNATKRASAISCRSDLVPTTAADAF